MSLSDCLQKYATHLKLTLQKQHLRQSSLVPVRQLSEHVVLEHRPSVLNVKNCYTNINDIMNKSELLTPVHCTEQFSSSSERYRFIQGLHLSVPVDILRYSPGGSHMTVFYLCRVQEKRTSDEEKTQAVQFYERVRENLPVFHTRAMKADFKNQFQNM